MKKDNLGHCYTCQKLVDAKYIGLCTKTACVREDQELLEMIYDDLKMRADIGVVNISNSIWMRLTERVNKRGDKYVE